MTDCEGESDDLVTVEAERRVAFHKLKGDMQRKAEQAHGEIERMMQRANDPDSQTDDIFKLTCGQAWRCAMGHT
eukprot:gene24177-32983_t